MIDTRDYKTHEELADAMQLERDISELEYLDKKLAELELSFKFYKHKYELSIEEIKSRKLELRNNIDEYYKKLRLNRRLNSINNERGIDEDFKNNSSSLSKM